MVGETDKIFESGNYFNEDSPMGAPFVQPAPRQPPRPSGPPIQGGFAADGFDPEEDLSQYVVNHGQRLTTTAPTFVTPFVEDENDTSIAGRLFNSAVKLKRLGESSNLVEKIRIFKELQAIMLELDEQVKEDRATLLKELGIE